MNKALCITTISTILLGGWAAAVWLLPIAAYEQQESVVRYGVSEGLEVQEIVLGNGQRSCIVADSACHRLFGIPLRGCLVDTRYRNGQLRFREKATRLDGYIDRQGLVHFLGEGKDNVPEDEKGTVTFDKGKNVTAVNAGAEPSKTASLPKADLMGMAQGNPFHAEAMKVLRGKLDEQDASCRQLIIDYCEHFRSAYTTKDIDFLRQTFSDKALIIVGHVVKTSKEAANLSPTEQRVTYAMHTKADYLNRLQHVFDRNRRVDVRFSDFHIMRHPTMNGIYGVTLRQRYKSDSYADDGWLFLLWDFRDRSMPVIHVRTWQPAATVKEESDMIGISDFNLQ